MKRIYLSILPLLILNAVYSQKINWQAWGENAFKAAKNLNKPVFLDVGTEWCTACNLMEENTYTDTTVIGIINRNFVAIKADAEAQPDVGARFLQWGWPALIFLDSDGNQLMALQGNRRAGVFTEILNDFLKRFKEGKISIQDNNFFSPEPPDNSDLTKIFNRANNQLHYYYDSLYAGWGYQLKIPLYQPVEYSFWAAKTQKKPYEKQKALKSLTKYAQVSDRVCGGVYFGCSSGRSWKGAAPEKRSEYQGGVLHNYAEAYLATGDIKWLNEAKLLKKYLLENMLSKDDSLFYNSQEEYLNINGNPPGMPPEKYFTLTGEQRAKYGFPPIDKTIYTDINFRIVKGFIKLYEATQDPQDLNIAVCIGKKIISKAQMPDGWFKSVIENKNTVTRMRELPSDSAQKTVLYLKPQGHSGIAMLALYQYTNDSTWLMHARKLNAAVNKELFDKENGGYFSTNYAPMALGGKKTFTKVLVENALFARFLIELSDLTGEESYLKWAEGAIRSVSADKMVENEERLIADYVLAIDKLRKQHLVFTIVTNEPKSIETKNLIKQIQTYYHPQKLIKVEAPGHYPDLGKPSLFVCSKVVCSQPISNSENTKKEIDTFINRLKN